VRRASRCVIKRCRARADQSTVEVSSTHDVVSPELALVDPELARSARLALPRPGTEAHLPARGVATFRGSTRPSSDGRQVRARGLVLVVGVLAVGAGSMLDLGMLGSTSRDPAAAVADASGPALASEDAAVPPTASAKGGRRATRSDPAARPSDRTGGGTALSSRAADARSPVPETTPPAARSLPSGPLQLPKASGTAIVWAAVPGADAYRVELVRNGTRIYAVSSRSPELVIPRTWRGRSGTLHVQPEDEAYVWPVAEGRRGARPVVDGVLVLDLAPLHRFPG
jgi:hypothetical protein